MPHLSHLKLTALPALHLSIETVPIGRLVQCGSGVIASPIVGLRCEYPHPGIGGLMPGIVPFEGDKRGIFIGQDKLSFRGGIDVTERLAISVMDPTPKRPYAGLSHGELYVDVKTQKTYMWSHFNSDDCWLCIDLEADDCGQMVRTLEFDDLLGLGFPNLMSLDPVHLAR